MKKQNRKGFTLIEIVISIGTIAVLISIISYYILNQISKSKDARIKEELNFLISIGTDYAQTRDSFGSFCNTSDVQKVINGLDSEKKFCHHTGGTWTACAKLHQNSLKAWCVDYNGIRKEIDESQCEQNISNCN
jgi:prepilin-type N-terminal cleavage/methylation domain-containing protein